MRIPIAVTVRKLMNDQGLKAQFVAERIGITPEYFSRLLNGKAKFSEALIVRIMEILEVEPDMLFATDNDKTA